MGATSVLSMTNATVGWPITPVTESTTWKPLPPDPENRAMVLGSVDWIMSTAPVRSVDSRWVVSGIGLKVIWSR